ncbi:hypothetical protein Hanom_Chr06g00558011 [Helianthus anomalus]
MVITGRQCIEGPNMKLGFDKSKFTCFRFDESVNPFHDDYYKKAIYHRTDEYPPKINKKQIGEGSSKEKKQALVVIQDDEGFNWNKYIPEEKMALVSDVGPTREESHATMRLSAVNCYLDPKGNPTVDPDVVDFEVLVATIPTTGVFYSRIKEDPNYEKEMEERTRRVIYASVEKTKSVEEIVDESQKLKDEILKKTADSTTVADQVEVKTQIEFTESFDKAKSTNNNDEIINKFEHLNEVQCKKCMETCSACTEKDENLRSRNIEFTKIENVFKDKCKEMFEI